MKIVLFLFLFYKYTYDIFMNNKKMLKKSYSYIYKVCNLYTSMILNT